VFTHNDAQRALAEEYRDKIDASGTYDAPVVTEIVPLGEFYRAEDDHQNYWNDNPSDGYCRQVIPSKLAKLKKLFGDKLKK
jgi:peptide-methionine (S)-S-oxide reductase